MANITLKINAQVTIDYISNITLKLKVKVIIQTNITLKFRSKILNQNSENNLKTYVK